MRTLGLKVPMGAHRGRMTPGRFRLTPVFRRYGLTGSRGLLVVSLVHGVDHHRNFQMLLRRGPFGKIGNDNGRGG